MRDHLDNKEFRKIKAIAQQTPEHLSSFVINDPKMEKKPRCKEEWTARDHLPEFSSDVEFSSGEQAVELLKETALRK